MIVQKQTRKNRKRITKKINKKINRKSKKYIKRGGSMNTIENKKSIKKSIDLFEGLSKEKIENMNVEERYNYARAKAIKLGIANNAKNHSYTKNTLMALGITGLYASVGLGIAIASGATTWAAASAAIASAGATVGAAAVTGFTAASSVATGVVAPAAVGAFTTAAEGGVAVALAALGIGVSSTALFAITGGLIAGPPILAKSLKMMNDMKLNKSKKKVTGYMDNYLYEQNLSNRNRFKKGFLSNKKNKHENTFNRDLINMCTILSKNRDHINSLSFNLQNIRSMFLSFISLRYFENLILIREFEKKNSSTLKKMFIKPFKSKLDIRIYKKRNDVYLNLYKAFIQHPEIQGDFGKLMSNFQRITGLNQSQVGGRHITYQRNKKKNKSRYLEGTREEGKKMYDRIYNVIDLYFKTFTEIDERYNPLLKEEGSKTLKNPNLSPLSDDSNLKMETIIKSFLIVYTSAFHKIPQNRESIDGSNEDLEMKDKNEVENDEEGEDEDENDDMYGGGFFRRKKKDKTGTKLTQKKIKKISNELMLSNSEIESSSQSLRDMRRINQKLTNDTILSNCGIKLNDRTAFDLKIKSWHMKKVIPDTLSDKFIDLLNLSISNDKNKGRESMDEIVLFIVAFFEYNINMERIELQTLKSKKGYHGVYTEDTTNLNKFNMNQNLNMTNTQITSSSSSALVNELKNNIQNIENMDNSTVEILNDKPPEDLEGLPDKEKENMNEL